MSMTAQVGNAAAIQDNGLDNLRPPTGGPVHKGEHAVKINGVMANLAYSATEIAKDIFDGVASFGNEVATSFRAFMRGHGTAVVVSGASLTALLGGEVTTKGANYTDPSISRNQMTADNSALNGFYASASVSIVGFPIQNNESVTFLWNNPATGFAYYGIATHENQNGLAPGSIYLGRDYLNNPGIAVPILSITPSPTADFSIIQTPITSASISLQNSRDPNSKIAGIAVAADSLDTVYVSLLGQLSFINQVTGSSITAQQILSGQSIIGAPQSGQQVWSDGYGAWSTLTLGRNDPDGLPGQWEGTYDSTGSGLFGSDTNPNLYFASGINNDFYSANGASGDSGSPGVIQVVPEPSTSALAAVAFAATLLAGRRRK